MKFIKPLFYLVCVSTLTLACGVGGDLLPALPVNMPTETLTAMPPMILPSMRTPIPSPEFLFPTLQPLTYPAWVMDFSDPILMTLNGRRPDFQDEFTKLNQGWFYSILGSNRGPYYAYIQDEALLIKQPEEIENSDFLVYNPKLIRRNFVLSFDFRFGETQPDDTIRFQFDQTTDRSVAFDLSKNKTWTLHWGLRDDWNSDMGTFEYFSPERINILIIMRGEECAVYLNDTPLTYLSNCRTAPVARSSPRAVTFHMLADPRNNSAMTIDNVKLWDLDKVIGLP